MYGERYSYWMIKVAELQTQLKVAEDSMCPECFERYKKDHSILIEGCNP